MSAISFSTRCSSLAFAVLGLIPSIAEAQVRIWTSAGSAGDEYGWDVRICGDIDGDGRADVLVGAPSSGCNGPYSGVAFGLRGSAGSPIFSACGTSGTYFAANVRGSIDIDGDGHDDMVVTSPDDDRGAGNAGACSIYSGATGMLLRDQIGSAFDEFLGTDVATIADIDGDGVRDYVLGVNAVSAPQIAEVYSGASGALLFVLTPTAPTAGTGWAIADAGDVDSDGFTDIIVGDYYGTNSTGAPGEVIVFSGFDGSVIHVLDGEQDGDSFGYSVAGLGDVNLDGYADFAVGAPDAIRNFNLVGKLYVYSGKDGALLVDHQGDGALGFSIAGTSDLDRDGYPDYLASDADFSCTYCTQVRLYSGRSGLELYHVIGLGGQIAWGGVVDSGADLDGDGGIDFVIGGARDDANGMDAGVVYAYSLARFFADAQPKVQHERQVIDVHMAETAPGNLIALALVAVDGAPTFSVLALSAADGLGSLTMSGKVPRNSAGHDVDVQAFAIDFQGRIVAGNVEHIEFIP